MRIALVASLALGLLACKKAAPSSPPATSFDERQACGAADDCAAVEGGCCDPRSP